MSEIKMPDVNYVIIAGNLTKDPVIRTTTNGTPVANFTIACNRKFKDNTGQWREDVCYIGVVAWYKLAETCYENLKRGNAVIVDGELQSRSLKTENGHFRNIVEIKARRIQFLNKKETSEDVAEISVEDEVKKEIEPVENDIEVKKEEIEKEQPEKSEEEKTEKFDFGYNNLKL
jgi:single-strand DNA-binding protein